MSEITIKALPKFAQKGIGLPRKQLFSALREQYHSVRDDSNAQLAEYLETTPQAVSAWANESSSRCAPMWAILRLCHNLNYQIVMTAEQVVAQPVEEEV